MMQNRNVSRYLSFTIVAVAIYSTALNVQQQQQFQNYVVVVGQDIIDTYKNHPHSMYMGQYDTNHSPSRRLIQNDDNITDTCTNICVVNDNGTMTTTSSERINSLLLSRAIDVEAIDDEDDGIFNGLFRLIFSSLFSFIFRRSEEQHNTHYVVPTSQIVPMLSIHSSKFKSLSQLIRNETAHDSELSTRPDILQKMYALSAENMESVSMLLDPILHDIEQQDTIDLPTLGCNMRQVTSFFKDVTIPNIKLMLMILFTITNNPDMALLYSEDIEAKSNMSNNKSNNLNSSCLDTLARSSTNINAMPRKFEFREIIGPDEDVGIIVHILTIIALLVFLPLSVVVGPIIGIIILVIELIRVWIGFTTDYPVVLIILEFLFVVSMILPTAFGLVFYDILFILDQIRAIIHDIASIFIPTSTVPPSLSRAPALQAKFFARDADDDVNIVLYYVQSVLNSPMDTIIAMMHYLDENKDNFRLYNNENDRMDCEMATLICNSDALLNALPF